jgi:hypothetical protein
MNGNGSSTNSMMRNMYHHHHQNTSTRQYQYPTTAAAAVMNNAMNGIGRYTAAQMNSMTPYNSMAVQFSSLPNTNNVSNMNLRQV